MQDATTNSGTAPIAYFTEALEDDAASSVQS
jgi:hypothetical protein